MRFIRFLILRVVVFFYKEGPEAGVGWGGVCFCDVMGEVCNSLG